jgi:hypothetical protein
MLYGYSTNGMFHSGQHTKYFLFGWGKSDARYMPKFNKGFGIEGFILIRS